jgi:hypothetical protein
MKASLFLSVPNCIATRKVYSICLWDFKKIKHPFLKGTAYLNVMKFLFHLSKLIGYTIYAWMNDDPITNLEIDVAISLLLVM